MQACWYPALGKDPKFVLFLTLPVPLPHVLILIRYDEWYLTWLSLQPVQFSNKTDVLLANTHLEFGSHSILKHFTSGFSVSLHQKTCCHPAVYPKKVTCLPKANASPVSVSVATAGQTPFPVSLCARWSIGVQCSWRFITIEMLQVHLCCVLSLQAQNWHILKAFTSVLFWTLPRNI